MVDELHQWLERWAPLAEWGVAVGTAALALATFALARRAREEAAAVRAEAEQLAAQGVAALRAYVYPEAQTDWVWGAERDRVLPLRNGGPGLALNVNGQLHRGADAGIVALSVTLRASSIAPGQAMYGRLVPRITDWAGTWHGEPRYGDLNGDEWTTRFTIKRDAANEMVVEHEPPTTTPPS